MHGIPAIHTKTLRKLCKLSVSLGKDLEKTRLNDLVKKIMGKNISRAVAYEYAHALMFIHHALRDSMRTHVFEALDEDELKQILGKIVVRPYSYEYLETLLPYLVKAINCVYLPRRHGANPVFAKQELMKNISELSERLRESWVIHNESY